MAAMPLSLVAQGVSPDAMETLVMMPDTQEMGQAEDAARAAYEGDPSIVSAASRTMLSVAAGNWVSKRTLLEHFCCELYITLHVSSQPAAICSDVIFIEWNSRFMVVEIVPICFHECDSLCVW